MKPIIDPRHGDIEDDASSTKSRSILSLAGSLFAEISLPKLAVSWIMLFALPGLLLGLTPLIVFAWVSLISDKIGSPLVGIWPALLLITLILAGLLGAKALFRVAESSFWSLNSIAIEPLYTICREGIRYLVGRRLLPRLGQSQNARSNVLTAAAAGVLVFSIAVAIAMLAWPSSRWLGNNLSIASPRLLASVALANSVVLVSAYLAIAAIFWAYADATMPQPVDFSDFGADEHNGRTWRIAHLSDIHAVGERYGYRIESGRAGARGNTRLKRALAQLDAIHARAPIDIVLITGDLTDAGRSAEWSELLEALTAYPWLVDRVLILPGNHDLNIIDRANPARLDLPMSPNRKLRRLRFLSAADFLQGERVRLIDLAKGRIGESLSEALTRRRTDVAKFANVAKPLLPRRLDEFWASAFPMIVPPDTKNSLGILLLNSNADAHFSFTNALGIITTAQMRGLEIATASYPEAYWIVALHHHVVEYPRAAKKLSERIGTALVNGNWFVRRLAHLAGRTVLMHGHRHTDWTGECARLLILSAPSPVMEAMDDADTYFYMQTLAIQNDELRLLLPERIVVKGETGSDEDPGADHLRYDDRS